jgi:glycosyltransferase involved in cell wall biosynthesis
LIPTSLKLADKIVAVSEFTRNEIMRCYKIPGEKIRVVHNATGDDFSGKYSSVEYLKTIKKRYDLPEKFILYLGTMQPRKNLPLLVEAYGKIRTRVPGLKLVLAGGKNAYNFDRNIGKTIHKFSLSEDVIFTGYVPEEDKPAFFQLAEVFCSPSLYEGFGIPILEAMSAGTPVIASEIPAYKEIAGDSAWLFNPSDSDSLAEKIYDVCTQDELRRRLIDSGKKKAKEFSWKQSAEKTLAIYDSM